MCDKNILKEYNIYQYNIIVMLKIIKDRVEMLWVEL